jgi:alpha-tubulin suppressor-like RCC1 family protein
LFFSLIAALSDHAKIAKLYGGQATCFAVSTKGEVFVWGLNNYNQAGVDKQEVGDKLNAPVRVKALDGLVRISSKEISIILLGFHHIHDRSILFCTFLNG